MKNNSKTPRGVMLIGLGTFTLILGSMWLFTLVDPRNNTSFEDGLVGVFFSFFLIVGAVLMILVGAFLVTPRKTRRSDSGQSSEESAYESVEKSKKILSSNVYTTGYPLNYSALKESSLLAFKRIYRHSQFFYKKFALLLMIISIALITLLGILYLLTSYNKYYLIAPPIVLFIGVTISTLIDIHSSRIGAFAKDNGFTYSAVGQIGLMSGTMFSGYGKSAYVNNLIEGKLANGQTFSLLSYSFDAIPRDKKLKDLFKLQISKTNTYEVSTIRFEVSKKLPHIILDSKKNDLFGYSKLPLVHKRSSFDQLELEGHFNDFYSLFYTVSGTRKINKPAYVLSILSPDLMEWLINSKINYDIELVGNKVFIHAPFGSIQKGEVVSGLFHAANLLAPRMKQALKNFKDV